MRPIPQVVRWVRSFPFRFISDRQYVIARQLYSVTHDGAVHHGLPPYARAPLPAGTEATLTGAAAAPAAVPTATTRHAVHETTTTPGSPTSSHHHHHHHHHRHHHHHTNAPSPVLYIITKCIDHPGAYDSGGTARPNVVQIPSYYSMFRCRQVADPWGGPRPATEVVLLHCEDMRIPENLARWVNSVC